MYAVGSKMYIYSIKLLLNKMNNIREQIAVALQSVILKAN